MFFNKKQKKKILNVQNALSLLVARSGEQPVFYDGNMALYLIGEDEVWLDETMVDKYKQICNNLFKNEKIRVYELGLVCMESPIVESIDQENGACEYYYALPTTGEARVFFKSEIDSERNRRKYLNKDQLKTLSRDMDLTSCAIENTLLVLDGYKNDKNALGTYADQSGKLHQFPVYAIEDRRAELGLIDEVVEENEI